MGIQVRWDEEASHVLYYDFDGTWTWDDLSLAFDAELEMVAELTDQRYDVIVDLLKASGVPRGQGITQVYSTFKRSPANSGIAVIMTHNSFIRAMFGILARVYPDTRGNYILSESTGEAREIIRKVRAQQSA